MPSPSPPWLPGIQPSSFTLSFVFQVLLSYIIFVPSLFHINPFIILILPTLIFFIPDKLWSYFISSTGTASQSGHSRKSSLTSQISTNSGEISFDNVDRGFENVDRVETFDYVNDVDDVKLVCWYGVTEDTFVVCVHYGRTFMVTNFMMLLKVDVENYLNIVIYWWYILHISGTKKYVLHAGIYCGQRKNRGNILRQFFSS